MHALFISDLHLNAAAPENADAFFGFMAGEARRASHLFILGDLFEYWARDDDRQAPFNARIVAALAELAALGTAVSLMPGNRDVLLGPALADAAGLTLLPDPFVVELGGETLLLSHGDALCTDDEPYQAFRRQVRDPAWQAAFLARPLAERKAIISGMRERSEQAKQEKTTAIMDVNRAAVASLLRQYGYPPMIHGHTHRPATHATELDGHPCVRQVLSDWRGQATWLAWDGQTFSRGGDWPPP